MYSFQLRSSRSSKMSKDGSSGPMFGGDILPITTDVRGISLWTANDKSEPTIFPISPEPMVRPGKSGDRRLVGGYAPSTTGSGGNGGALANLQLHDGESILLPPSTSDPPLPHHGGGSGSTNEAPSSSSNSQLHCVVSSNIFSVQNDNAVGLHGSSSNGAHVASTSSALGSLQSQIDYISAATNHGGDPVGPLHLSALPLSQNSGNTLNLTTTTPAQPSFGISKTQPSIFSLQQPPHPSAGSSPTLVFSTAGSQQFVPTTSSLSSTSLKLPPSLDFGRRTLQL